LQIGIKGLYEPGLEALSPPMYVKPKGTDAEVQSAAKKPHAPCDQRTSELVPENYIV
jgi:hypothetical protein